MRAHAIQTGTVAVTPTQQRGRGPGPLRLLNTMRDRRWTEPLPIWAWVIEHPEGLIVVDTGETARVAEPGYFPRWQPYFRLAVRTRVRPEEEIGPQMQRRNLDPAEVRWLVMTHLHTDHAGGLEHFPNSEILVSRTESSAASGALGRVRGYLPHRWPTWFKPRLLDIPPEPYGPFPESMPLTAAGDVRIVATRGHSPGHMSVALEDEDHAVFFAGDTSYTEELMLERVVDGVSSDVRAARQTLDRINSLVRSRPVVYLPSHDRESGDRLERRRTALGRPAP